VVQQFGQSIGGVMAKTALSLVSGVLEGLWIACPHHRAACGHRLGRNAFRAIRYEDDNFAMTRQLCAPCLAENLNAVYQSRLRFNLVDYGFVIDWIDLRLVASRCGSLSYSMRSPNVPWIRTPLLTPRIKGTFLPYLGVVPIPSSYMVSVLSARLVRAQALGLNGTSGTFRACDDILELARLGYPYYTVRALVHRLPLTRTGARELRHFIRACRAWWPPSL
jgi:hypothetical protein